MSSPLLTQLQTAVAAQEDHADMPRLELGHDVGRDIYGWKWAGESAFKAADPREIAFLLDVRVLRIAAARQEEHPFFRKIELSTTGTTLFFLIHGGTDWKECTISEAAEMLDERATMIARTEADNYNHGIWFDSWDANMWEMCRLRARNPGVPVHFLLSGANGSAKTYCAAVIVVNAMMQTKRKLFWCLTRDEPSSETVQQKGIYFWLPNEYKTTGGGIKGTARGKLKWNDSGGFTDNRFSMYHGASMEFRFWSADVATLEGPRPFAVWSDEEIPMQWIEGVNRRLLTAAEGSRHHITQWNKLLEKKQADPAMKFPRDKIGDLMTGFHLISYTPAQGYTETVRTFMDGAVMEQTEADKELLPRRDPKTGEVLGGEIVPRLIHSKDKTKAMRMMYAWENPMGGNWRGMREIALRKRNRAYTLWWCYGVAEKTGDSPFSNFNAQVHVRPRSWMPKRGTWYLVIDPVASGGKCWTMIWAKVAAEQQGHIWPGDIVICHEYPQCDDLIPGIGLPDEWATPGGKDGIGIKGAIQHAWPVGYEWRANEIKRIEEKLSGWEWESDPSGKWESSPAAKHNTIIIPDGNRIMDSRAANTETQNQSESKTLIEWMEDNGLYFIPAGRDSGAQAGETNVQPGEQMVNNALYWNRDQAQITARGWMEIDPQVGRGPKLWILENCTNVISALQNYPGVNSGGKQSSWKDIIDPIRYLIIADPYHRASTMHTREDNPGGW